MDEHSWRYSFLAKISQMFCPIKTNEWSLIYPCTCLRLEKFQLATKELWTFENDDADFYVLSVFLRMPFQEWRFHISKYVFRPAFSGGVWCRLPWIFQSVGYVRMWCFMFSDVDFMHILIEKPHPSLIVMIFPQNHACCFKWMT